MDYFIRRESEQINNNYDDNSNVDETYNYKKWEWGYLRVSLYIFKNLVIITPKMQRNKD